MSETTAIALKSLGRGLLWGTIGNALGLMQLLFLLVNDLFDLRHPFNWVTYISTGAILFYIASKLSSIAIDYRTSKHYSNNKPIDRFLYFWIPAPIGIFVVLTYVMLKTVPNDQFNTDVYSYVVNSAFIFVLFYTCVTKAISFGRQGIEDLKALSLE